MSKGKEEQLKQQAADRLGRFTGTKARAQQQEEAKREEDQPAPISAPKSEDPTPTAGSTGTAEAEATTQTAAPRPGQAIDLDSLTQADRDLLLQAALQAEKQRKQDANQRTKRPVVLVTPKRFDALKQRAAADKVSMSELINRALDAYLGQGE